MFPLLLLLLGLGAAAASRPGPGSSASQQAKGAARAAAASQAASTRAAQQRAAQQRTAQNAARAKAQAAGARRASGAAQGASAAVMRKRVAQLIAIDPAVIVKVLQTLDPVKIRAFAERYRTTHPGHFQDLNVAADSLAGKAPVPAAPPIVRTGKPVPAPRPRKQAEAFTVGAQAGALTDQAPAVAARVGAAPPPRKHLAVLQEETRQRDALYARRVADARRAASLVPIAPVPANILDLVVSGLRTRSGQLAAQELDRLGYPAQASDLRTASSALTFGFDANDAAELFKQGVQLGENVVSLYRQVDGLFGPPPRILTPIDPGPINEVWTLQRELAAIKDELGQLKTKSLPTSTRNGWLITDGAVTAGIWGNA